MKCLSKDFKELIRIFLTVVSVVIGVVSTTLFVSFNIAMIIGKDLDYRAVIVLVSINYALLAMGILYILKNVKSIYNWIFVDC